MPVLGITGGIASGKSSFLGLLQQELAAQSFDSDLCVRGLLQETEVLEAIHDGFGPEVFIAASVLDKRALREIVFSDPLRRAELEAILHPKVRQAWMSMVKAHAGSRDWLYVDIPLLFETGAEKEFDTVVVVACPLALQRQRLVQGRGMSPELADKIIASQLDLPTRLGKAGQVVWNAGTLACLRNQTRLFAAYIQERYG